MDLSGEHYIGIRQYPVSRADDHSSTCRGGRLVSHLACRTASRHAARLGVSASRTMDIFEKAERAVEEKCSVEGLPT